MTTTSSHDLDDLLGQFVGDLGATVAAGNVVIGDRLGLYRALAEAGPLTSAELATYTGTAERYVREWLRGQAAGGWSLSTRDRPVLDGPAPGRGLRRSGRPRAARRVQAGAGLPGRPADDRRGLPHGEGFAWGDHDPDVFTGCEQFYRPGYVANLVSSWIPAVEGLADRLTAGTRVADVGAASARRPGSSPRPIPASTCIGFDNASRLDRPGPPDGERRRPRGRVHLRACPRTGLPRRRLRAGDHLRLPARHGRSGRRRPTHQRRARRRRRLDDRRAVRRCRGRRQPHAGWAGVLLVLQFLCVPHAISEGPSTRWATRPGSRRSPT